jgi:16S rRNA G1207 methylase RsmC
MKELSIVLAGEAGQGINSVEKVLVALFKKTDITSMQPKNICRVYGAVLIQFPSESPVMK